MLQHEVQIALLVHLVLEQSAEHGQAHLNDKLVIEKPELLIVGEHYEIAKYHLFVWKAAFQVTAHYIGKHRDVEPGNGCSTGVRRTNAVQWSSG